MPHLDNFHLEIMPSQVFNDNAEFEPEIQRIIDDQFGFLDAKVAFCNYGSFGVVPKDVLSQQFKYMTEVERDPDLWMRTTSIDLWLENRQAVAKYFGTDARNLAFIVNTTSGVNAVLSSIKWEPHDVIILTKWTFSTVRVACEDLCSRHDDNNVSIFTIDIQYPIPNEQYLIDLFDEAVDAITASGGNPRLAIVDAISSQPAILFPYEAITRRLKQRGVEVMVDGAQAPGQINLDLDALGADYFAGNLHKWFFCPKGTAVIYVAPQHQSTMRAPVVSMSGCQLNRGCKLEDPLATHFFWQGTSNNTSYACVGEAIEFIEKIGGLQRIQAFNTRLCDAAAKLMLAECPRNCRTFELPPGLNAPFMRNIIVRAPGMRNPDAVELIQHELYRRYKVWTAVSGFGRKIGQAAEPNNNGHVNNGLDMLFRISAQICNKLENYERLVTAINQQFADD